MPKTNRLIISGDVDHVMTASFLRILTDHAKKPVTICLNTDGGDCYQAREICDMVRRHGNVTIHAFGACQSAGVFILSAAKHRISSPSCTFLIHYGTATTTSLTEKEHTDKLTNEEIALVQIATGAPLEIVKSWFDREYIFDVNEALKINLIQKVAACL